MEGTDPETSDPSGDPALALDTRGGSLVIVDDDRGTHGAFRIMARIDSFERR